MEFVDYSKQGETVFNDYVKQTENLFQPKTVNTVYSESLHDLNEMNLILEGKKAPVKSLGKKVSDFFKDMFYDKKGIIDQMNVRLQTLNYCLSDIDKMHNISEGAYYSLVDVVNKNYDALLNFSKSIPATRKYVEHLKEELNKQKKERLSLDISDDKAVELGKLIFQNENIYNNKLHQLENQNEQIKLLQNFLKRNKNYTSTMVDIISFYERASVLGVTIAYQIESHISSLKAGAQLVVNVSDLDEISSEVMKLANRADDVWGITYDKILDSGKNVGKNKYSDSKSDSLGNRVEKNLNKREKILDLSEDNLSLMFREI